jgi:hypothetical protein
MSRLNTLETLRAHLLKQQDKDGYSLSLVNGLIKNEEIKSLDLTAFKISETEDIHYGDMGEMLLLAQDIMNWIETKHEMSSMDVGAMFGGDEPEIKEGFDFRDDADRIANQIDRHRKLMRQYWAKMERIAQENPDTMTALLYGPNTTHKLIEDSKQKPEA